MSIIYQFMIMKDRNMRSAHISAGLSILLLLSVSSCNSLSVVDVNQVLVWEHNFYQAQCIIGPGVLAEHVRKTGAAVLRPIDIILADHFSGSIDDSDIAIF